MPASSAACRRSSSPSSPAVVITRAPLLDRRRQDRPAPRVAGTPGEPPYRLAADALAELRVEPLDLLQQGRRVRLLLVGDAAHLLAGVLVVERERPRLEPV